MNSLYFTEEHELFRKSLQDFLQKRSSASYRKMGKNRHD